MDGWCVSLANSRSVFNLSLCQTSEVKWGKDISARCYPQLSIFLSIYYRDGRHFGTLMVKGCYVVFSLLFFIPPFPHFFCNSVCYINLKCDSQLLPSYPLCCPFFWEFLDMFTFYNLKLLKIWFLKAYRGFRDGSVAGQSVIFIFRPKKDEALWHQWSSELSCNATMRLMILP